jgi:hypothetical protein
LQPVEPDIEGDLDAAKNRRFNVVERDLQAGDRIANHAATLRRSLAAGQFQASS